MGTAEKLMVTLTRQLLRTAEVMGTVEMLLMVVVR